MLRNLSEDNMATDNMPTDKAAISRLLDLQKFMPNKRIQSLAESVGAKYGLDGGCRELSDDEIEVWAAGDLTAGQKPKKPEDDYE